MSSPINDPSAIYRTEYWYSVRGILCRNSFHHYTEVPGAGAQFVNQMVLSKMIVYLLGIQSVYIAPIQLTTRLMTANINESYTHFFQGEGGGIAATPEDPRLGIYIKIETDHGARAHYTGGVNIAGIPQNWTIDSPVIHEEGMRRYREIFTMFVDTMGKDASVAPIKWVVFSPTLYKANPNSHFFWSQRVSHIGVRRWMLTLRTRRPRPSI